VACANKTLGEEEVDDKEDDRSTIDEDLSGQGEFGIVWIGSPSGAKGAGERSNDTEGW